MIRKILMLVTILFFAGRAFADVTAEIISKQIDSNGNIEIHTQYKIDGAEVQSRYEPENGKYYWVTRYNALHFFGMTEEEAAEHIAKDLRDFSKRLIVQSAEEELEQVMKNKNEEIIESGVLENIVGQKVSVTEAEIEVDSNFDNIPDKNWKIKTDGTKIETDIINP